MSKQLLKTHPKSHSSIKENNFYQIANMRLRTKAERVYLIAMNPVKCRCLKKVSTVEKPAV